MLEAHVVLVGGEVGIRKRKLQVAREVLTLLSSVTNQFPEFGLLRFSQLDMQALKVFPGSAEYKALRRVVSCADDNIKESCLLPWRLHCALDSRSHQSKASSVAGRGSDGPVMEAGLGPT